MALADFRNARSTIEREIKDIGMQFDIADSPLLRELIGRARREGYVAGESRGLSRGVAATIVTLLGSRFGSDEVPEGPIDHLTDLQPEVLDRMVIRLTAAPSIEDILGSHMPAPTSGDGR